VLSDEDLLDTIKECHTRAKNHSSTWRENAREDFAFVAGQQWDEDDVATLKEQMRPAIVFNRVGPVIDAVSGAEVTNRQEVRYIPREEGDAGVNEVLTGAAQWVRDQCDAEDEESDAFLDAIICGMGWTETHLEFDEDPDGRIYVDRTDPIEMFWDPTAKKRNLADKRWVQRLKRFSRKEVDARWPDKADEVSEPAEWDAEDEEGGASVDATPPRYSKNQSGGPDKSAKKIAVLEHQWFELDTLYRVADPDSGKVVDFPAKRFEKVKPTLDAMGVQYVKTKGRRYLRAFVAGNVVLEKGDAPCSTGFTYKPITAKRERNTNTWYGLVRPMKDPQRWANKWLSQTLHIVNSNAKGGLLAEQGAFVDQRKAEDEWARPDAITMLKDGGLARVKEKTISQIPAGTAQLMEYAIKSIPDVTGVNLEVLGLADRQQAGVLEYQRKQAGLTILATLFDALRRYRKEQGRVLLYFIREYISDGRLIRIVGKMGQKFVPLVKDASSATYDVIVDDAPTSPNQKERVFQILSSLLPTLGKMGIMPPMEVLDYAPLPTTLIEAWKKQMQSKSGPNPEAQAMQMAELKKLMAEAGLSEARTQEIFTRIGLDTQKLDLETDKAALDGAMRMSEPRQVPQMGMA
jgi:hypothetical protein